MRAKWSTADGRRAQRPRTVDDDDEQRASNERRRRHLEPQVEVINTEK